MLILNAKTLEEIARAEVDAPLHVDLHGLFIPKEDSNWAGVSHFVFGWKPYF